MVPDLTPMLAQPGLPAGGLDGWAVEPKLDGWRVLVTVDRPPAGSRRHPDPPRASHRRPRHERAGQDRHAGRPRRRLVAGAGTANDFYALVPRLGGNRRTRPATPLSFWRSTRCGTTMSSSLSVPTASAARSSSSSTSPDPAASSAFPEPTRRPSWPPARTTTSKESCLSRSGPYTGQVNGAATGERSRPRLGRGACSAAPASLNALTGVAE